MNLQIYEPCVSTRTEWLQHQSRTWKVQVQPCAFPQTTRMTLALVTSSPPPQSL